MFLLEGNVVSKIKEWNKICICDIFWRPNSIVAYVCLIGEEIKRSSILKELKSIVKTVHILPSIQCSFCYATDHTIKDCQNCSYCLFTFHKFSECNRYKEKVLSRDEYKVKMTTYLQHLRENYKKLSSAPYFKLPNGYTYQYYPKRDEVFGIDVEKSEGFGDMPATQVLICSHISGCNVRPIYYAFINNSDVIKNPKTHYSGVNLSQIFGGLSPEKAKADILKISSIYIYQFIDLTNVYLNFPYEVKLI
jgi:hypothetical protein